MKYLPTGCPNNEKDPARRYEKMSQAATRLKDEILEKQDKLEIIEQEMLVAMKDIVAKARGGAGTKRNAMVMR